MFLQSLFFWQHLLDFKKVTSLTLTVCSIILAGVVIYLGSIEKSLHYFELPLVLPILISAFLYGLKGGVTASLVISVPAYILAPDIKAFQLTILLISGLVSGILREGLNWEMKKVHALLRIQQGILSRLPLKEVIDAVVAELAKLLAVADVRIFLYERERDELVLYHDFHMSMPDSSVPYRIKPGRGIAGNVFNRRISIVVPDMSKNPICRHKETVEKMGLKSALGVPLIVGQAVIGVFILFTWSKRHFSRWEVRLVEGLAVQVATALEAARSEKKLQEKASRLSALYAVDRAILEQAPLAEVLNLASRLAAELMEANSCFVGMLDEKKQGVALAGYYGYTEEEVEAIKQLRVGEGAWGWAVLQNQLVAMPDVGRDPRLSRMLPILQRFGVRSMMAIPLASYGKAMGAVVLRYNTPRSFMEENVEFFQGFANQIAITIKHAEAVERVQEVSLETVRALMVSLDARDPYTAGHSERVAQYCVNVAHRLGLSGDKIYLLEYAGLLHDVGKIGCAERVWQKRGKLDDAEMAEMKKHSYVSSQIVKSISFLRETAPWVYHHHERWDGCGYPDRLKGPEIPLESRILLVVDAYDAMVSSRPYRPALGKERALAELAENAGKQFDPEVVKVALEVFAEIG